jgi:hypothetical protein
MQNVGAHNHCGDSVCGARRSKSGIVLAIAVVLVIALLFAALLREAKPVPLSYIHAGSPAATVRAPSSMLPPAAAANGTLDVVGQGPLSNASDLSTGSEGSGGDATISSALASGSEGAAANSTTDLASSGDAMNSSAPASGSAGAAANSATDLAPGSAGSGADNNPGDAAAPLSFPTPHFLVVGNASYTHPNPLRWAAFGEPEDEYRYALGGAVHGNQHILKRFATTAMPREIEANLELEVYGAPAHYDARVRSNEPGYTGRLDWLRMSTPRGRTTGSTEALRVFSFARSLWPRVMQSVECSTVLDWIPASMWAKRWTQLCVFEAIWQLSLEGSRQHDSIEVATARSSARCSRRLQFVYSVSDGRLFPDDADQRESSPSYCACELTNALIRVPHVEINGALPTATFYVSDENELRRAEYVLGCGLREARPLVNGGVVIQKPGPPNSFDYDVVAVEIVIRAIPPAPAPSCDYEYFHTIKYAYNPYHDIFWQYLPSRVTAAFYGVPWERQRVGWKPGPPSRLRTWMESHSPIPTVPEGTCFASRFVTGVHPTVVEAGRVAGIAGPDGPLKAAFTETTRRLWQRPAAPGHRVVFLNRGAAEGRHVVDWRAVRGCEYLELPIADMWNALRDVKLLIMPYGSNFVNVGFLAPGSTFLLLIDADAVLRQFWKGFDLAWIGELEAQCRVLDVTFRVLQYSGASQEELFAETRAFDSAGRDVPRSVERINATALNALIADLAAAF